MDSLIPSLPTTALLLGAALAGGMVDAIAGGGGLIVLPALLAAGLPPHLALGTNKLAGTFGTLSASRAYVRRGLFRPRLWTTTIIATFAGALLGTLSVWRVSSEHLKALIPLLIIAAGVYVLVRRSPDVRWRDPHTRPAGLRSILAGAPLGFYDGFVGPGTGAFWTTTGMGVFHLDLVHASALARFMNFVSNVVSLGAFAVLGLVDYGTGLAMGLCVMAGAWVGARTAIRFGASFIRPVFVLVVMAIAAKLAWQEWGL